MWDHSVEMKKPSFVSLNHIYEGFDEIKPIRGSNVKMHRREQELRNIYVARDNVS